MRGGFRTYVIVIMALAIGATVCIRCPCWCGPTSMVSTSNGTNSKMCGRSTAPRPGTGLKR